MADASCVYGEEQEDGNFIVYGILFGVFLFPNGTNMGISLRERYFTFVFII